jgi:folate-binding protein YgfZ
MAETDDPRVLGEDTAIVDAGGPEIVRGTGADRVTFLQRLLTGDVEGTPVGGGTRAMLLTVKGHIVADLLLFPRGDEVRMLAPPGQGQTAATALARYAVMDDFTAAVDPGLGLLALHGPRAAERLAGAGVQLPAGFAAGPPWSHQDVDSADGPLWVVRARAWGADGLWLFAGPTALGVLGERLAAVGVPTLAPAVAEALRVLAGEPRFGAEITADYFPMEVGRNAAIDYRKGCFLGQEPIVRIRDRGHINWRLVGLRLRAEGAAAPGDRLEADVKAKAGRITSVARLPGQLPVALGLLHVSVPAGAEVRIHHQETSVPAEVVALEG